MPVAFYSYALRWTLLRAALLAMLAVVALDGLLGPWAAVVAVLAAGLVVVDTARARRADARSSSAETIVSR